MRSNFGKYLIDLRKKYPKLSEEDFCSIATKILIKFVQNHNVRVIKKGKKYITVMTLEEI
jgi:hypothetical protein